MDKSKLFLKMCDMAGDLQKIFIGSIKNDAYVRWYDKKKNSFHHDIVNEGFQLPEGCIILFTNDQLHDMLCMECSPMTLMERIVSVWSWEKDYWALYETFNQLWLAFLMKEKYDMVWNDVEEHWARAIHS